MDAAASLKARIACTRRRPQDVPCFPSTLSCQPRADSSISRLLLQPKGKGPEPRYPGSENPPISSRFHGSWWDLFRVFFTCKYTALTLIGASTAPCSILNFLLTHAYFSPNAHQERSMVLNIRGCSSVPWWCETKLARLIIGCLTPWIFVVPETLLPPLARVCHASMPQKTNYARNNSIHHFPGSSPLQRSCIEKARNILAFCRLLAVVPSLLLVLRLPSFLSHSQFASHSPWHRTDARNHIGLRCEIYWYNCMFNGLSGRPFEQWETELPIL